MPGYRMPDGTRYPALCHNSHCYMHFHAELPARGLSRPANSTPLHQMLRDRMGTPLPHHALRHIRSNAALPRCGSSGTYGYPGLPSVQLYGMRMSARFGEVTQQHRRCSREVRA